MVQTIETSHNWRDPSRHPFEIVERKGLGHPDTLSDALAEHLSRAYCAYTLQQFGAILRHQFDKVAIMCGRSKVTFGGGELVEPIRVLLNGRASARLGNHVIPIRELLTEAAKDFFRVRFPMLHVNHDFRFLFEVRHGDNVTTGGIRGDVVADSAAIHYRFNPRSLDDLPETHLVEANDTSLGCAWGPYSPLENTVLKVEQTLNSPELKLELPWLGNDIKVMGVRRDRRLSLVAAVPILSYLTGSEEEYFERIEIVEQRIQTIVQRSAPEYDLEELVVNSGDNAETRKLYMNFTGSSIESGDEGVVGRGNRIGGIIAPLRPMTMEGIAGKNPRYHVGKVYCAAAWEIASKISRTTNAGCNIYLINKMGEPLAQPWRVGIEMAPDSIDIGTVEACVHDVMSDISQITSGILNGDYPLY